MSIKLRISITKEVLEATKDCKVGNDTTRKSCAISYAIRVIWPDASVWMEAIFPFGDTDVDFTKWRQTDKIWFPHNQITFISSFDRSTPAERAAMQPFSFEIEVPDSVIGEVNIEEIRRICEGSKTLELV